MKFSYLLIAFFFLILNGCSDFSSESNEFELSGKYYACDGDRYGEIIDDSKLGKKQYCNGYRWIDLVPEDSIVTIRPESKDSTVGDLSESKDSSQIMYECNNGSIVINKNLCSENPKEYLPLDDSEYPYAGIPRIVIETENFRAIKDRETEIPAKLQIWGENAPESEIMELTIRGRGNSSWIYMPKKSYKIELRQKQSLLGMSKDKDWALVANYADKTLMKNYIMYHLSNDFGMQFVPNCLFVEVFINKEYLGVYNLTETLKVNKNRINLPQTQTSYLVEIDRKYRNDDYVIISNMNIPYNIHYPQDISTSSHNEIESFINNFETFLTTINSSQKNAINEWINIDDYVLHFWLQEFSKNPDANFFTSVYFTKTSNGPIRMGPIWDFDLAFGGHDTKIANYTYGWRTRDSYWNKYLFKDSSFIYASQTFWNDNKQRFLSIKDTIKNAQKILQSPAANNFKRWDILSSTENSHHPNAYSSYDDAVNDLISWINERVLWIQSTQESSY